MQYYFVSLILTELILLCFSFYFVKKTFSDSLITGILFTKESGESCMGKPGTFCFKTD